MYLHRTWSLDAMVEFRRSGTGGGALAEAWAGSALSRRGQAHEEEGCLGAGLDDLACGVSRTGGEEGHDAALLRAPSASATDTGRPMQGTFPGSGMRPSMWLHRKPGHGADRVSDARDHQLCGAHVL